MYLYFIIKPKSRNVNTFLKAVTDLKEKCKIIDLTSLSGDVFTERTPRLAASPSAFGAAR